MYETGVGDIVAGVELLATKKSCCSVCAVTVLGERGFDTKDAKGWGSEGVFIRRLRRLFCSEWVKGQLCMLG
jgi:hypothetical protein